MYDFLVFDSHKEKEGFLSWHGMAPAIAREYMVLRGQYLNFRSHLTGLNELRRTCLDFHSKSVKLLDKSRYCMQNAIDEIESRMIYLEPHVMRECAACTMGHLSVDRRSEYPELLLTDATKVESL